MMTIESIRQALVEIVEKIDRAEFASAANDIEFLMLDDQLPRLARGVQRPDKGFEVSTPLYPLGIERARSAETVLLHLDRAPSTLEPDPSIARQEMTAAIVVWNGKVA